MTKKPHISMSPVKSSQVSHIGYDASSKTLAVQFGSGGVYHYHGVEQKAFNELISAKSIGAHLGQHIKPKHKFTKIGE